MTYYLDTPANNVNGVIQLIAIKDDSIKDEIILKGTGNSSIQSNGSVIIINVESVDANNADYDCGSF